MNATFPDHDTIDHVLSLATRAPSIHNSQPWQWRVGHRSLHLYADRRLHLPYTDPDQRDLILSCGAILHHAVIALASVGWHAKVHRLPNPAEPNHLAAVTLSRRRASDADIILASTITRRRTDRRRYGPSHVPREYISVMASLAARSGVLLRQVEHLSRVQGILAEAAELHAASSDYLTELALWSGRHGSLTGVPATSTPAPDPSAAIHARTFSGASLFQAADSTSTDDCSSLVALATNDDNELAWLRAGEATSLMLLTATALGLASCPVTEPLEISSTRDALQIELFGASGFPQMLLRFGWAQVGSDPLPPTPRRPVADVVERLECADFDAATALS
ncbi:MAG: nitroreductase family protein [Mycobacterium sp.]